MKGCSHVSHQTHVKLLGTKLYICIYVSFDSSTQSRMQPTPLISMANAGAYARTFGTDTSLALLGFVHNCHRDQCRPRTMRSGNSSDSGHFTPPAPSKKKKSIYKLVEYSMGMYLHRWKVLRVIILLSGKKCVLHLAAGNWN